MSALAATEVKLPEPPGPHESAVSLLARARSLRDRAKHLNPVVADAYLRRAAELRLQAWVRAVHSAPIAVDDFIDAA